MPRKKLATILLMASAVLLVTTGAFGAKPAPNTAPVVSAFDVPDTSPSPIPVLTFTATDPDPGGTVTGYLITESSSKPGASAPGWTATAPTQYATTSTGTVTLYAWAKDDKDAVSNSLSDMVTIPQPPVDADTLDGKDSTDFAAALHDHDPTYQRRYANVIVVAKSGGDFTDPIAAANSILDASAMNPYLMKIMPGSYDLGSGTLFMKEYVDIEGSGENTTVISSSASSGGYPYSGTVAGADNSEIRFLSIINTGANYGAAGISNQWTSPKLTNVTVSVTGASSAHWGIYGIGSSSVMTNVTVDVSGGTDYSEGVRNNNDCFTIMNNVSVTVSGATPSGQVNGVVNDFAFPTMTNVTVATSGLASSSYAVNNMGSSVVITNSAFAALGTGGNNYGIRNYGSSVTLSNVTATADNGSANVGMVTGGYGSDDVEVDRSTIEGSTYSITHGVGTLKIGSSKLAGAVTGSGTITCAGSYNGTYSTLNEVCQ